jgi:transposase
VGALRKKEVNLSDEEKTVLQNVFQYAPDLAKAYQLQKQLDDIFNQDLKQAEAKKQIRNWLTVL